MSTLTLANLDINIQLTFEYLTNKKLSFGSIAEKLGISRQAAHKRVQNTLKYLLLYNKRSETSEKNQKLEELERENKQLKEINLHLKRELIVRAVQIKEDIWLISKIREFIPNISIRRFNASQKKYFLDMCDKFVKAGGTIKEFCRAINKSTETLNRWKKAYKAKGLNGLEDKKTMPKNFGNKVTAFVKQQLIALFLKFPYWDDYQYHKYIRFNPSARYYVSLPTIRKLKNTHKKRTKEEKERLKKRWGFAPGTDVWTIDFTCILKTENYKLQLLTVSDQRSRFLFETALFLETSTKQVIDHMEDLFIKYGKPNIIKADNGPEFKIDCKNKLNEFMIHLLNSPTYYAKFNGAHERIHRTLKKFISNFENHKNITFLVQEINLFLEEYNYELPHEYLYGKTPSDVYFNDKSFVPKNTELIKPYEKNGEIRIKFTNRNGNQARISMPLIEN
jgi:putative transposase